MKTTNVVLYLLLFYSLLSAQEASIRGRIMADNTDDPLIGANVILIGTKLGTVTDQNGEFIFEKLQKGTYTINITYLGYQNITTAIALTKNQELNQIFRMNQIILTSQEEIFVEAERPGLDFGFKVDENTVEEAMPDDIGKYFRELPNTSSIKKGAFCLDPVIRGTSSEQLNLQVDNGIKVVGGCPNRMDPSTAHMQSEDLQKIEIVPGPYTVRFGPNMSGLVNMVMKKPDIYQSFELHSSFESGYETISEGKKARFSLNGGTRDFNFYLNGGVKNFKDFKDAKGNKVPGHYDAQDYSLKLGYNFNRLERLQFSARESFHKDVAYPSLPMDAEKTNTHIYAMDYLLQTNQSVLSSLQAKIYLAKVQHVMTNLTRSDRAMDGKTDTETRNIGIRLETKLELSYMTRLYIGSEFYRLHMNGLRKRDGRPGTMMQGKHFQEIVWPDVRNNHFGIYAEAQKSHNFKLLFSTGIRYDLDYYEGRDFDNSFISFYPDVDTKVQFGNVSFHFGTEYLLSNRNAINLKIGQGIRSPAVKELYVNRFNIGRDGYEYVGNPQLKPEYNRQVDLSFTSKREKYHLLATVFYSAMKNFISAEYNPVFPKVMKTVPGVKQFINIKNAYRTGGEFQFDFNITPELTISNAIAYTYGQNTSGNEPLVEIPPLEYKITARYNFGHGNHFIRIDGRMAAKQPRISESFKETKTPGFNIWNLLVGYKITKNMTVSAGIENILNQWYYEHLNRDLKYTDMKGLHFYEPGRNLFLYVKYHF